MMVKLEVLSRDSAFNNGVIKDNFRTMQLSVNTNSIISVSPSAQRIDEVDGRSASNMNFTEIVYSMGSSTQTITVLGEYGSVLRSLRDSRKLLHG